MSSQLPQEILIEILVRLPVKSLLRFRSVSRSWNSLITSQTSISLHLSHSIEAHYPLIILNRYDPSCNSTHFTVYHENAEDLTEVQELGFPTMTNGYFYVGACNGLVCLSDLRINDISIILWNPSINICFKVPIPRIIDSTDNYNYMTDYCVVGWGYDCWTSKYKVLRLIYVNTRHQILPEVEVFVLGTDKWRRVDTNVPFKVYRYAAQAYLHGAIHWIGCRLNQSTVIVVFDVHEEVFRDIEIPSNVVDPNSCSLLVTVYEKSLCLLERPYIVDPRILIVWVMKRYGVKESWTKQFNFNMQEVQGGLDRVLVFRKHDKILCENACKELVSYDPKSGMVEQVVVHRKHNEILVENSNEESAFCQWNFGACEQIDLYAYHDAIPHMECLVLLGTNGME